MPAAKATKDAFLEAVRAYGGSATQVAKALGMSERGVYKRMADLESKGAHFPRASLSHAGGVPRFGIDLENGVVVVASDAHYWPGPASTAHRAFCAVARVLRPKLVVLNGDVADLPSIGRHDPHGWEIEPQVAAELDTVRERTTEIADACRGALRVRTVGNHDIRFDRLLAMRTPELRGVYGTRLADHLPEWKECISVWVNGSNTIIKHRYHNGIHAVYNNTLRGGTSIVTGHMHSMKVTPWTDYRGTRYGVDTGMLGDPDGEQFSYAEDNPRNWRAGFAVLTYHKGRLLPPELCEVIGEGQVVFRGQVIGV